MKNYLGVPLRVGLFAAIFFATHTADPLRTSWERLKKPDAANRYAAPRANALGFASLTFEDSHSYLVKMLKSVAASLRTKKDFRCNP